MNGLKQDKTALEGKVMQLQFDHEQVVKDTLIAVNAEVNPLLEKYAAKCARLRRANNTVEILLNEMGR